MFLRDERERIAAERVHKQRQQAADLHAQIQAKQAAKGIAPPQRSAVAPVAASAAPAAARVVVAVSITGTGTSTNTLAATPRRPIFTCMRGACAVGGAAASPRRVHIACDVPCARTQCGGQRPAACRGGRRRRLHGRLGDDERRRRGGGDCAGVRLVKPVSFLTTIWRVCVCACRPGGKKRNAKRNSCGIWRRSVKKNVSPRRLRKLHGTGKMPAF